MLLLIYLGSEKNVTSKFLSSKGPQFLTPILLPLDSNTDKVQKPVNSLQQEKLLAEFNILEARIPLLLKLLLIHSSKNNIQTVQLIPEISGEMQATNLYGPNS